MILVPKYAESLQATSRMVFIKQIKEEVKSTEESDLFPRARKLPILKKVDFGKPTQISTPENHICYCFNCKDTVIAKSYEYVEDRRSWLSSRYNVYECQGCKYRVHSDNILHLGVTYAVAKNVFVDDNKLKIKIKTQKFTYYNNRLLITFEDHRATMNLDTGMTYKLPIIRNGKLVKKSNLMNTTYDFQFMAFHYSPYSSKCKSNEEIYRKAFEEIRAYKIEKLNIYIPTLEEQWLTYIGGEYESKFDNREMPCSFDIALFNRFPTTNIFKSQSFYDQPQSYYCDYEDNARDINKINLKKKKLNSMIRKVVTPEVNNPTKEVCKSLKVPFSKTTKKIFESNIYTIIWYKNYMDAGFKLDSINKLFNAARNYHRGGRLTGSFMKDIYVVLEQLMSNISVSENSIINKVCNFLSGNNSRLYLLVDFSKIYMRIIKILPNYVIDFKSNSFEELHDIVSKDFDKIRRMNKNIEYTEKELEMFNHTCGDLTFTLAKDTHTLIDVGSDMSICVGSYDDDAFEKRCIIVIARDKYNNNIMCIELDKEYSLIQSKLKHNGRPKTNSMELTCLMEWIAINKLYINSYDVPKIDKYKYLIDNPEIIENYPKKNRYNFETLEACKVEYEKLIKAEERKNELFVDSEAEVI